ncbi:MAG: hypothetical protein HZA51_06750 [Planctomycetes bacterium]|nr:hypothetical protein [Planctomycetota bacterium]
MKLEIERQVTVDSVVATFGYYLVVMDLECELNSKDFVDHAWKTAEAAAAEAEEPRNWIMFLNRHLNEVAKARALVWSLLVDSIHKARFSVIDCQADMSSLIEMPCPLLGNVNNPVQIELPSGKIGFGNMLELGDKCLQHVLTVRPGTYRVWVSRDDAQEYKHQSSLHMQTDVSQYPENDGPDWEFIFQRID